MNMTVKEYKLYKETGVVPWYKASAVKRLYYLNPSFDIMDAVDEINNSILLAGFAIGFILGVALGLTFLL